MEPAYEKKFPLESKHYKLYEEVGEGVSATVFRALCIPLNEIVAIKVLDLERCNNDFDGIRREVQTMILTAHPNLLRAHCSFTADQSLWVVMPYMAGGSCLHIMKTSYPEGFEEPVIATLLREVLKALVYLHSQGHIHRDVKAGNILVDSNGSVKLGDFGVSACMFDTGDRQRSRNTFVGTPCWMAPEVMQQLHGYDFKADIWSFGITALELAHGHAPFSKYPPMKVLLMTLQNAPPGLDYERDKRFTKSFKEMVAACLVKDPKKRPSSEKLLKHQFFKHARPYEYLAKTILDGLPPLGDRFRQLKAKEANFLVQNKAMYGDKEHLSQQEYIRGISAWNFNLEDLKTQAALIQDFDGISSTEDLDYNKQKDSFEDVGFAQETFSPIKANYSDSAPKQEDELNDLQNVEDSLASFPTLPLQALKDSTQPKYQVDRNFSGPLHRQKRDTNNFTSGIAEDTSEGTVIQHRGRFKVTSADRSPKGATSSMVTPFSGGSTIPTPSVTAASVLPSLQYILQQNSMQREQIVKLIKFLEQTPGHHAEVVESAVTELLQVPPASTKEKELQGQVIQLQQSIGSVVEELHIVLILVLNAVVGVWQETNAEKALEALKELQSESTKVLRDGYYVPDLPARELVPGDIVELRVGDKAPADMRVAALKTSILRVEQSSLTGEAMPVFKSTCLVFMDDCELQAKECMIFAGTTVVNGSCICIVVSTGMSTEIGKIQTQIHEASLEETDTPLKKKLDEFGGRLTSAIGIVCLIVWVINYKSFLTWDLVDGWPTNIRFSFEKCTYYLKIAVALAVAAIPEGLPAVITTCLALGTRKMAKKNAIVRKLPSVETLGCTTVICSDKTGTLTTNQMSVSQFFTLGGKTTISRVFHVEGTTYDPKDGGIVDWTCYNMDANLESMAEICAVCNEAGVFCKGRLYQATGLPTEAALKVLVEKMGIPDAKARNRIRDAQTAANCSIDRSNVKLGCSEWWTKRSKRIAMLEFDRIRKSMSVIVREPTGNNRLLVKGAVESVLDRCLYVQLADGSIVLMDESCRQLLILRHSEMSSRGLRCLAVAYKDDLGEFSDYYAESHPAHKKLLDPANYSAIESDLIFVGVVGLRDPPRGEVHEAIEACGDAGIKVMVITGDNKSTAEAICREIRLFSESEDIKLRSYTGKEFMALSSTLQKEILSQPGGMVFSRAEPKHKQEIVRMLKEMGEIVAMTGDGVNDAPALKLADIGIAMGITGTEVAKEASDMVLADDNFSTIVSAVAEGRSIYNNMKAFIRYMISSNVGEVISIFLTAALGIPECLIPVQLLWVNLVTDGPPATALGFNPADVDIMRKPPRKSDDALINSWVLFRYLVIGSYVGIATVGVFIVWYTQASFLGINLAEDGHTLVTLSQLRTWGECSTWSNFTAAPFTVSGGRTITFSNPCDYFSVGKVKAMTLSLSVLVAIEMFNSLNALSEDNSLVTMPPWRNPFLLVAMSVSFGLHFVILYLPVLADVFGVVPLTRKEWCLVILVSAPVVLIDEVLKIVGRSPSWRKKKQKMA